MDLEDLLLKREELPIGGSVEFSSPMCVVPIHPSLFKMPNNIRLNQGLAYSVMNDAIDWYAEDMKMYAEKTGKVEALFDMPSKRDLWCDGLKLGRYTVHIDFPTGFILSLNLSPATCIRPNNKRDNMSITSDYVAFEREKFAAYSIDGRIANIGNHMYCDAFQWVQQNVYTIPQAAMLRDWAALYHNVLLKEMDKIGMLSVATV